MPLWASAMRARQQKGLKDRPSAARRSWSTYDIDFDVLQ
jgi:hypothetical protein